MNYLAGNLIDASQTDNALPYAYAGNDPVNSTDPTGLDDITVRGRHKARASSGGILGVINRAGAGAAAAGEIAAEVVDDVGLVVTGMRKQNGEELNRRRMLHDCARDGVAAGMEDLGAVVTPEVTFIYEGKKARFDIVASSGGVPVGVTEVKTGFDDLLNNADPLVRNQAFVSQGIRNGKAIPVGWNAQTAGFQVGKPIGRPLSFYIAYIQVPRCSL